MNKHNIGPAQLRMLIAWRDYVADKGYQPSVRELGGVLGLSSTNAVLEVRNRMIARGLLEHSGVEGRARSVLITPAGHDAIRDSGLDLVPPIQLMSEPATGMSEW